MAENSTETVENTETVTEIPQMIVPDEDLDTAQDENVEVDLSASPPPERARTDRVRQEVQQELANQRKQVLDPLSEKISQLTDQVSALAERSQTSTTEQHASTDDLDEVIEKIKSEDYLDPQSVAQALHGIMSRQSSSPDSGVDELRQELSSLKEDLSSQSSKINDAEIQSHWNDFSSDPMNEGIDGRELWEQAYISAGEMGLEGDSAHGAASVEFKHLVASERIRLGNVKKTKGSGRKAKAQMSAESTLKSSTEGASASTSAVEADDGISRDQYGIPNMIMPNS